MGETHTSKHAALRLFMAFVVFAVVLALTPFTSDPTDVKILLYQWGSFLALGWLFTSATSWRRPRVFFPIVVVILVIHGLAAICSSYPGNSLVELSKLLSLCFLYYVASQIYHTPRDVRPLLLAICLAVACSSVYAFLQKAGLDVFPWDPRYLTSDSYTELPGTFGNPNLAAHALILAEILAVYLAQHGGAWRWCYLFLPLFITHHYFTGQRGGVVALSAAILLLLVARSVRRRVANPAKAVGVTLVVTGLLSVACVAGIMGATKWRTGSLYPLDMALLVRYKSYCSASEMILKRPVLGFGPGNYRIENPAFWTEAEQRWFAEDGKKNDNAHIDILESGVEAGFPGAILHLVLMTTAVGFGLLYSFTRTKPTGDAPHDVFGYACAAFFTAFAVDGLFGFNLRVPVTATLFFVVAGAMDGVLSSGVIARPLRLPSRALIIMLALANAMFAARVFYANTLYQKGLGAMEWKAYSEAGVLFGKGEALTPWNWLFSYQRGLAARGLNQPDQAVQHLKRSLTQNPNRLPAILTLSDTHLRIGQATLGNNGGEGAEAHLDAAEQQARQAVTLCTFLPGPHEILGKIDILRHDWPAAQENVSRAVQYGADNRGELLCLLGDAYLQQSLYSEAEASLAQAVQVDPASMMAWPVFLRLARSTGHYAPLRQRLEEQLARAAELGPASQTQTAWLSYWLAQTLEAACDDPDTIRKAYQAALIEDDVEIWGAYCRFVSAQGVTEAFFSDLALVAARHKQENQPLPVHLAALELAREADPASLNAAIELIGAEVVKAKAPYQWVADILFQKVVAGIQDTEMGVVYLKLGQLYLYWQMSEKAAAALSKAVPLVNNEDRAAAVEAYARALCALDKYSEAEAFFNGIDDVRLAPGTWEIYADILVNVGKTQAARSEYEAMLRTPGLSSGAQQSLLDKLKVLKQ